MTKVYELPDDKKIMADVDEKHHTATVSVYALDDLVAEVNKISDGIPLDDVLDKIRAEIEKHTDGNNHCDEYLDGYNNGMKDALEIIDKYGKEQE